MFIDLICKYWHKRCEMLFRDARLDFGDGIDNLVDSEIVTVDDEGYVRINFLDEQMEQIGEKSKKNSLAGRRSAELRAQRKTNDRSTTVEQTIQDNTKQNKTKQYGNDVYDCLMRCLVHFPQHLIPEQKSLWKWAEVIDKLNRIDNVPFNLILEIVEKTRADDFWCRNFLSIPKLRSKNKEGIKYVVVFNEQIKKKNGKQTYETPEQFVGSAKDISSRLGLND